MSGRGERQESEGHRIYGFGDRWRFLSVRVQSEKQNHEEIYLSLSLSIYLSSPYLRICIDLDLLSGFDMQGGSWVTSFCPAVTSVSIRQAVREGRQTGPGNIRQKEICKHELQLGGLPRTPIALSPPLSFPCGRCCSPSSQSS